MKSLLRKWLILLLFLWMPILFGSSTAHAARITLENGTFRSDYAFQILTLTNRERAKENLPALKMNEALMSAAKLRAAETHILFSHTRPDDSSCFTVSNRAHGENLVCCSYNVGTPEKLMDLWMNSSGHRANILNRCYKSVGIACCQVGNMINAVQLFCWYEPSVVAAQGGNVRQSVSMDAAPGNLNLTFGDVSSISLNEWKKTSQKLTVKNIDTEVFDISVAGAGSSSDFWRWVNAVPLSSKDFLWSSSNTAVAGVKSDGTVYFVGDGSAIITASLPGTGQKLMMPVTCKKTPPFTVTVSKKTVTYNGKKQKPSVTVKAGGQKVSARYYTVKYSANKNVGTATVTVTGKGKYAHYLGKATFKIRMRQGQLTSLKSKKTGQLTVKWKKDAQATYYELAYSRSKNFKSGTVTLKVSGKTAAVLTKLASNKKYYVRIRPVRTAGGKQYYGTWSAVKKLKVK